MKQRLRSRAKRKTVSRGASAAIQRRLATEDWWRGAFQVGLYRSTPSEPATDWLLADLLARRVRTAVPVRRGRAYAWGWVDENTRWRLGAHGIREPRSAPPARPTELQVILVPGMAFDVLGGRLGHGRGHFDRLLARRGALLVGLCSENRMVASVPMEAHDVRMDVVVTEKRTCYAPPAEAKLERLLAGAGHAGRPRAGKGTT